MQGAAPDTDTDTGTGTGTGTGTNTGTGRQARLSVAGVDLARMSRLAAAIAAEARPGDAIILNGDLASGKTTFVKALADAMGTAEAVSSPTYTIAHIYRTDTLPIIHVDAYRLSGAGEYLDLGFEDLFADHLTVVEWGEPVAAVHPEALHIGIGFDADDTELRHWTLHSEGAHWARALDAIGAAA